jgi:uncharacterized repeat protein (TIGR02543 family)
MADRMSKKKLVGIIAACAAVIVVAVLLIRFEPWAGTPSVETYILTVSASPLGTGSISPSGGEYEFGEQVTLTAYPASGYTFDHWSGDASGNSTAITVTMNHDYSITANFASTVSNPLTLRAPACGATGVSAGNLGFGWTGVAGAEEYSFVLSANPDLSDPIVEATSVAPFYMYTGALDYNCVYYWQVKALSGGFAISQSPVCVFYTTESPYA